MPNPLSKVSPTGQLYFSAGVLRQSPFAAHVSYVIALWAHIDGDIASILSRMLNADVATGSAMYMSLVGSGAQKAALDAAAREALPEWQYLLLKSINKVTNAARAQRNDFAHHVWGVCDNVQDAILLTHPKTVVEYNISHRQVVERTATGNGVICPKPIDCSKVQVFRQKDFDEVVLAAERESHLYQLFYATLQPLSGSGPIEQLLGYSDVQQQVAKFANDCTSETKAKLKLM